MTDPVLRVVLVSGLSGAGRSSILRTLEDLGYEAVDNPPLTLIEELVARSDQPLAIGMDARTRGFDAEAALATIDRLRMNPRLALDLVFAWAEETVLLRRYTETRRRHPLAPRGRVVDGITAEVALTAKLREAADVVVDTTDLPLPDLRRSIEARFGLSDEGGAAGAGLTVSLLSFAFPAGLPPDADMVFDARFLKNPHYVPALRPRTGLDPEVAAYVESDPDFEAFFGRVCGLLTLLLPRFVQEGKKYASIAVGCTGGKHRSVHIVERLAVALSSASPHLAGWRITVTHRELARLAGRVGASGPVGTDPSSSARPPTVQAQEA